MTRSAEVIAIFGPTASGKSAVAELVAARLGTEVVSADALQVYRGLPILTNQPASPTQARRDQGSRRRDVGRRVRDTRPCSRGRARRVERVRSRCRRNRLLPASGAGRSRSASFGRTGRPQATGGVLRRERRSGARSLAGARPACRGDRAPERPPPRRSGARACGKRKLLDSRTSTDCGRRSFGGRPSSSVSSSRARCSTRRIRRRTEEMFARGVVDEVRNAPKDESPRTAEKALGLSELSRLSPGRGSRAHRRSDEALCRVPEEVDAPDSGHRHDRRRPDSDRGGGCDSRSSALTRVGNSH